MARKIDTIISEIKMKGGITGKCLEALVKEYQERFWRAIRVVTELGVNKYIFKPSGEIAWIVIGKNREYLIDLHDSYCTCDDFFVNVVQKKNSDACYHILAKMLGEALALYNKYSIDDEEYPNFMNEWKKI